MAVTIQESREPFATWAFSKMFTLRKAVGIGVVITAAFSITGLEPRKWFEMSPEALENFLKADKASARAVLAIIQCAACFVLALLTPRYKLPESEGGIVIDQVSGMTTAEACRRIQLLVTSTYLAWALYYLISGLILWLPPSAFDQAISVTLNTIPSVLLFWLYLELAEFTVEEMSLNEPNRTTGESNATGSTATVDAAPHLRAAPTIDLTYHRLISIGVFAFITVPVWVASGRGGSSAKFIINTFDLVSACLNGVSLALVVGRLGSRIIGLGSIALGLLYFYAVIQPTAPTFHNYAIAQILATTVALPLKTLLWLVFVWAYTTGTLAEYVSEIRVLLTRAYVREQSDIEAEQTALTHS